MTTEIQQNLSHDPSNELLNLITQFKDSMLTPSAIFENIVKKAREENFSDNEITILISTKELKDAIPDGSLNYYKKKYGLPTRNYNLSKSTSRNNNKNGTEESSQGKPPESQPLKDFQEQKGTLEQTHQPIPQPTQQQEDTTTEEEPNVIYDPNLINNYVKKIAKLEEEIAKLKVERIPTRANKSDFKYKIEFTDEMFLMIKANSGICPLIGTHFCDKDDGYIRFDKELILEDIKKAQKTKAK